MWKVLRSPKQRETLTKILSQCFSIPVVVRWNSLFASLQQIYELRDKILAASRALEIKNHLRDSDFKFIAEYLMCLRPAANAIDSLQDEETCFYGYLFPTIVSLLLKIQNIEKIENLKYCQTLASDLIKNIERRFYDFFEITFRLRRDILFGSSRPLRLDSDLYRI